MNFLCPDAGHAQPQDSRTDCVDHRSSAKTQKSCSNFKLYCSRLVRNVQEISVPPVSHRVVCFHRYGCRSYAEHKFCEDAGYSAKVGRRIMCNRRSTTMTGWGYYFANALTAKFVKRNALFSADAISVVIDPAVINVSCVLAAMVISKCAQVVQNGPIAIKRLMNGHNRKTIFAGEERKFMLGTDST